jgi:hypothetical protein
MRIALNYSQIVFVFFLFLIFAVEGFTADVESLNTEQLFQTEKKILTDYFSEQDKKVTQNFPAFRDDFAKIDQSNWEVWNGAGSSKVAVTAENGFLIVKHPEAPHHIVGGLRTVEPLVAVPGISRSHFKLSFNVDTLNSNEGAFLIRPTKSSVVIAHSEIRLSFSKDFKTGCFSLYVDNVDMGKFMVPLVSSYQVSIFLGFDGISVYGNNGKKEIEAPLPSWAGKGTSHYLTLGLFASPVDKGVHILQMNSILLSYPRRMSVACPVYRCGHSIPVIDDTFSTISDSVWNYWTEGKGSVNAVKGTVDGLFCSLAKADSRKNPWGRMGLVTKEPVVTLPEMSGDFSVINLVIDSTFTSGARIALVDEPRDVIWESPHIRFGMERRGFYCQGWIGDEADLEALFDVPLSDECEFSLIIGRYGVYILDPGCLLVGSFKRPAWCAGRKGLYLVLYGQASRPGESVSFLYKSIEVTTQWCPTEAMSHVPIHKSSSPAENSAPLN